MYVKHYINPFNAELNPTCHLLALLGAHPTLHVSRIRVKMCDVIDKVLLLNISLKSMKCRYTGTPDGRNCR